MSGWKWTTEREKKQLEDSFWTRARQTVEGATYGPQEPVYGPQEPVSPIADIAAQARAMPHGGVSTAEDLNTPGISTPEDSGWSPPGWAKSLWDGVQNTYGAIGPEGIAERFGADPNREQRSLPGVLGEIGGYQKTMFSGQDVLRGFGVETSGLPDSPFFPVQQAIDVGASPYNAAFLGSTAVGAPLKALPGALARAGAKDLAIGTTGVVAAQQTDENLPEGTPDWARPVLSTAAAIGAGALAHKAISVAPGAARSLHDSAISLDARINEPVSGPGGYVEQGMAASRPYARSATETRVAAGASPPLPPVGYGLADELLARKEAQLATHPVGQKLAGMINPVARGTRAAMGLVDPAITLTPSVLKATATRVNAETMLGTQLERTLVPPTRNLLKAWAEHPAFPLAGETGQFKGHLVDFLERPQAYAPAPPELAAARAEWKAQMDGATTRSRTLLGDDVGLVIPEHPEAAYVPHVDAAAEKVAAGQVRTYSSSAKGRVYETLQDRWAAAAKRNEAFEPVLDLNSLVSDHIQQMKSRAGNAIFKRGVGGMTKTEVIEQMRPGFADERRRVDALVDSLSGRITTQERNYRLRDAENTMAQKDFLRQADRRDALLQRVGDRAATAAEKRQAAMEMLAESRQSVTQARNEALQAARATGKAGTVRGASARLERLAQRAESLDKQMAAAERAQAEATFGLGQTPAKPQPGLTRDALKAHWDNVSKLREEVRQAVADQREAMSEGLHLPYGKAAAGVDAAQEAADAAKATRYDLATEERAAIKAAQEAGSTEADPVLARLSGKVSEIEQRISELTRQPSAKGASPRANVVTTAAARQKADQMLAGLRSALEDVKAQQKKLRDDYNGVVIKDYRRAQETGLYYEPKVADDIAQVSNRLTGKVAKGLVRLADEASTTKLAGDASPTTIQGLLSVAADPPVALRSIRNRVLQGSIRPDLDRTLANESDMVGRYEFSTGRKWRHQAPEFSAIENASGPTGLGRIPAVRWAESHMFDYAQSADYALWKANREWLINRGYTVEAAEAGAAKYGGRIVPSMNAVERGVVPGSVRAAVERVPLTSRAFTSSPFLYAGDLTTAAMKGITKLGRVRSPDPATGWAALTGTERLAVRSLYRMVGPVAGTIAASAVANSLRRGDSLEEMQANLEETLFDPSSRKWWALQVGDRTIPMPGPIRSFARMVLPQKQRGYIPFAGVGDWLNGKFSPFAAAGLTGLDAGRGHGLKDYRGNNVLEGDAAEKIARGLMFGFEQFEPTTLSAVSAGVREGVPAGDVAESAGWQFLGTNAGRPSPTEQLNDIARGMGSDTFKDLPTKTQAMIKESHPDLWNEYLSRLDDNTKTYYAKRAEFVRDQGESDSMLTRGVITPKRWAGDYHDRVQQLVGVGKGLFDNGVSKPRNAHDRYLQQIEAASVGNAGVPDWDKVDSWLAEQSVEDQKYIAEHASVPWTPVVAEYMAAAKSRNAMYELPRYAGVSAKDGEAVYAAKATIDKMLPPKAPVSMQIAALEKIKDTLTPAQGQAALALIYGTLKTSPARSNYKKAHPEVDKWFTPGALVP